MIIIVIRQELYIWKILEQLEFEQNFVLAIVTTLSLAMNIDLTVLENNPNSIRNNTDFLRSL